MKISVVIPFYQKQPGILIKAINSILAQTVPVGQIDVVVDDASPVPASAELSAVMSAHPGLLRIIEQPNAGPAAARNKGLDSVPHDVEYVAFLDSDDEWMPDHLANALASLEVGNDLYFADHFQLGQTVGAFTRGGRIAPDQHRSMGGSLRSYDGDMFDQILTGNVIGTSTVVYRYRKFPTLRFREEFINAGEDYLFWLDLTNLTDRIAFSAACECTCGEGVNIFAGAGWGTEKSLTRLHYEMKFQRALPRIFSLTAVQKSVVRQKIAVLRHSFVADIIHRVMHRKPLGSRLLMSHARVDIRSFLYFAPIAAKMAMGLRG